jgi:DUF4097 and DUF4098 domain-containing protein YvlB
MKRTAFIFITLLLAGALPLAAQQHERLVKQRFQTPADPEVTIDVRFGDVTVTPSDDNVVDAMVHIAVSKGSREEAKRIAESVTVDIRQEGGRVLVRAGLPKKQGGMDNSNLEISVTVSVPSRTRLLCEAKFGDVRASGVQGRVKVVSSFGDVEVTRSSNVEVYSSYGDVSVGDIGGSMRLKSSMGGIKAFAVPGGRIESSYGDLNITRPAGPVEITSSMGEITVKECRGGTIKNSYGDVDITLSPSFSGTVEAETSFGDIDGSVEFENLGKKNKYGPTAEKRRATLGNGGDRLQINASFGDVTIDRSR